MFLEYGLFFTLIKAFSLNLNDPKINFPDTLEKLFYEKKDLNQANLWILMENPRLFWRFRTR